MPHRTSHGYHPQILVTLPPLPPMHSPPGRQLDHTPPDAPHARGRLAASVPEFGVLPDAAPAQSDMAAARIPCPVCGTRIEAGRARCFGCGWAVVAPNAATQLATVERGARIVYLLMGLSIFTAVPAVGALILAYADRGKARGSWLDSHFEWQMDTLWAMFWMGVAVLGTTWIGDHYFGTGEWLLLTGLPALAWYVQRIVKGWTRLSDGDPVTDY